MKHILLSDFLRAPAKTLDIAVDEEAYVVSLYGMQCAYRVRRVDDPNDLSWSLTHPQLQVRKISKSGLLGSREATRGMLNKFHLIMIYKHSTLEFTMQRMPFNAFDYPENDRITISKVDTSDKPKTESDSAKVRLIKKAIENDVKASVQILADYLLPAKDARSKEAKQPLEELVVRLINASANMVIFKLQQEQKE